MISKEILEKKIEELEELAVNVEANGKKLLQEAPTHNSYSQGVKIGTYWEALPENLIGIQRDTMRNYQKWYNSSYQIVKEYLPEKEQEIRSYYEDRRGTHDGVVELIQLKWNPSRYGDRGAIESFIKSLEIQRSILLSIPFVAEVKELNLRKIIATDFIDSELSKADYLYRSGFERCAGVIAGVALERHLKILCDMNGIEYKYDDTIEPLAQALYAEGKIDPTELKNYQHLGGIRNDCAHPKDVPEEVLKGRAKELIEKVKKMSL